MEEKPQKRSYDSKYMVGYLKAMQQSDSTGLKTLYRLEIPSLKDPYTLIGKPAEAKSAVEANPLQEDPKNSGTSICSDNPSDIENILGGLEDHGWEISRDSISSMLMMKQKVKNYAASSDDVKISRVQANEYKLGVLRVKAKGNKAPVYSLEVPSLGINVRSTDPTEVEKQLAYIENSLEWELNRGDGAGMLMLKKKKMLYGQHKIR